MCPNITVEVDRSPARWDASMICTQRSTGSLFGEIRSRTPSCSTSAAVPGVESRPASRSAAKSSSSGSPEMSCMCAISIGEYAWTCSCAPASAAVALMTRSQCR